MKKNIGQIGLAACLLACASFTSGPWEKHPIPTLSVTEAESKLDSLVTRENLKRDEFFKSPIILDNYFVFPNRMFTLEKAAYEKGIWVHIHTGDVGFYPDLKRRDQALK